jgi:hypothetical protein
MKRRPKRNTSGLSIDYEYYVSAAARGAHEKELEVLDRAARRVYKTPKSARAFLLKHGFITKSGKLHPRYRS